MLSHQRAHTNKNYLERLFIWHVLIYYFFKCLKAAFTSVWAMFTPEAS